MKACAQIHSTGSGCTSAPATQLRAKLSHDTVLREGEPLAQHTTLQVGGPADIYIEPATESDLVTVLQFCAEHNLPILVLGCGSNLLVRDGGFRGVVLQMANQHFKKIEAQGEKLLCGAGAKLKAVASAAMHYGLAGFEFMDGIPGSIGGALRTNAGAMGSCVSDLVDSVRCMDLAGRTLIVNGEQLQAQYRSCPFFKQHIALEATLNGRQADPTLIAKRIEQFRRTRLNTQPTGPSAGCIFKNPPGAAAGRLIDELGFKGARVGGAHVSAKHANFILTQPGATADDVLRLIELIKQRAHTERGVELELEVEVVGDEN